MVSQAYALNSYTQTSVTTAVNSLDLVVMLYNGAIDFLHRASRAIIAKDIRTKLKYIDRALAIIQELDNSLDMEAGGQVSANLRQLYHYMMQELLAANLRNDSDKLKEIISLLENLRGGFEGKNL